METTPVLGGQAKSYRSVERARIVAERETQESMNRNNRKRPLSVPIFGRYVPGPWRRGDKGGRRGGGGGGRERGRGRSKREDGEKRGERKGGRKREAELAKGAKHALRHTLRSHPLLARRV